MGLWVIWREKAKTREDWPIVWTTPPPLPQFVLLILRQLTPWRMHTPFGHRKKCARRRTTRQQTERKKNQIKKNHLKLLCTPERMPKPLQTHKIKTFESFAWINQKNHSHGGCSHTKNNGEKFFLRKKTIIPVLVGLNDGGSPDRIR